MDGNGQDRQVEPFMGPGGGISWNCLSEHEIMKTEELKSLWECFSSSLLLQDRAGSNPVVLALCKEMEMSQTKSKHRSDADDGKKCGPCKER